MTETLIQGASLPDRDGTFAIGIEGNRIEDVRSSDSAGEHDADRVIDADGALVASGFIDAHVHLDKAYVRPDLPPAETGTLGESIRNMHERKRAYTVSDVKERAERAIKAHVRNGCTRIRTHVDVDSIGELTPLEGVLAAREACSGIADVQIVAFPQEGVVRDQPTAELLREAIGQGADLVGGMPANERTREATHEHVDQCLAIASEHGVGVDMHVDETDDPSARSLEYLAARVAEGAVSNDVVAGHTCALAAYDDPHAAQVVDLVAEAGLSVITNPPTNLVLQGRHDGYPRRRGLTRIDELRDAGVTVAAGQDCLLDAFYPFGRASMLETAAIAAHAAQLVTPKERRYAWNLVSDNAARITGFASGITANMPATLNVFPPSVTSVEEAVRVARAPRYVFHEGTCVAETQRDSRIVP